MTREQAREISVHLTIEILKERAASGREKLQTMADWELYIEKLLLKADDDTPECLTTFLCSNSTSERRRIIKTLAELAGIKELYWLSFAVDGSATVVEAVTPAQAIREATERGLHPGGQAMVILVPVGLHENHRLMIEGWKYKRVSRETILSHGGRAMKDMGEDEIAAIESAHFVTYSEPSEKKGL